MGATWLCCNFSIWIWLFKSGSSIGWGSRKEQLVDKLGDPDSIFEKMRMIIDELPNFFKPNGFDEKIHASYMKIINPLIHSTITGEAGDNIGRGGRKSLYFKDESAFYERPEKIEAALGDNTNCQIDISSVGDINSIFDRKIETGIYWQSGKKIKSGETRIFIFDRKDHPFKTDEWYKKRRNKAEREGLLAIFLREVDRDNSALVEGRLISKQWINATIDAHLKLKIEESGSVISALDVADEGKDKHAIAMRKGILLKRCSDWFTGDVGDATRKSLFFCKSDKTESLQYDCIGIGAGVKSETNRIKKEGKLQKNLNIVPWNAASSPLRPKEHMISGDKQSAKNKDFFSNLKAQGWWNLRVRFEKTFKTLNGDIFPFDELISIDSKIEGLQELIKELSQPTYFLNGMGKMVIDKAPKGTKSPNRADAVMMCYWPITFAKVLIG